MPNKKEYICKRCHNEYSQKDKLKQHLRSSTAECEATYSDISREDFLKIVSDPDYRKKYLVKKTKIVKPQKADDLVKTSGSPLCYGERIPFKDIKRELTRPFSWGSDPLTHWEYASEQFYHNYKDVINVHDDTNYVELLYESNKILVLETHQTLKMLEGFYDWIADKPDKYGNKNGFHFKRRDKLKNLNLAQNSKRVWEEFLNLFFRHKNEDIKIEFCKKDITFK